jgi:hypothetical protein
LVLAPLCILVPNGSRPANSDAGPFPEEAGPYSRSPEAQAFLTTRYPFLCSNSNRRAL